MIGWRSTLCAAAALGSVQFTGVAAAAENAPSPREDAQARQVIADFAKCAADRRPEIAQDYVTNPGKWLAEDDWKNLVDPRCMALWTGHLRMDPFTFRGALAQRLIVKQLDAGQVGDLVGVPPLAWPEPAQPDTAGDDGDKRQAAYARGLVHVYVSRLAECMVRRDPAGVRHLFDTDADSQEEQQAFAAVAPAITACVPAGEQVRVDRNGLRAGLATSYFRLASAHGAGAAGANS